MDGKSGHRDWAKEREDLLRRRAFGQHNINCGRLRQIPAISIDRFTGSDLSATLFFLTHCHTDHMVGLDEPEFWKRLEDPNVTLYLSTITPTLMPLFSRYLRGEAGIRTLLANKKIQTLNVNETTEIRVPGSRTSVNVTFLPAAHCPGSVMIQFEYGRECILYTGDCRVTVKDLLKMPSLHLQSAPALLPPLESQPSPSTSSGSGLELFVSQEEEPRVKPITHLYVDTTFCSRRAQDFPGRADVLDELVGVVRKWMDKSPHNYLNLSFSARFSHEYVLMKLHQEFGRKSHVNQERFSAYKSIPAILNSVTPDPNTKFHLCDNGSACLKRIVKNGGKILTVRLSSLWFMHVTGPKRALMYEKPSRRVVCCYAMHSSLDEIADMIRYLKPAIVSPLVLPKGMLRQELEDELRRSAGGDFIYEDYVPGFGLTSSARRPVPPALPSSDPLQPPPASAESEETGTETDFESEDETWTQQQPSPPSPQSPSLLDLDQDLDENTAPPLAKVSRVEWNFTFSETESD